MLYNKETSKDHQRDTRRIIIEKGNPYCTKEHPPWCNMTPSNKEHAAGGSIRHLFPENGSPVIKIRNENEEAKILSKILPGPPPAVNLAHLNYLFPVLQYLGSPTTRKFQHQRAALEDNNGHQIKTMNTRSFGAP